MLKHLHVFNAYIKYLRFLLLIKLLTQGVRINKTIELEIKRDRMDRT